MADDTGAPRRVHGRRRGKRLRPGRQRLVETLLPRFRVDPDSLAPDSEPADLFTAPFGDVWLEIGFGKGEHLVWQAAHNPGTGFVGCEPFIDGVASLLKAIDSAGLDNIRIVSDDARAFLDRCAPAALGRVFILFPDPWPKARHHKRRFIQPENLDSLARAMRPGAELRIATDHSGYGEWILMHMRRSAAFRWLVSGPEDWRQRPLDWPPTRYEEKAIAQGRRPIYLRYERVRE